MIYYIYHIPGRKIGCTTHLRRANDQSNSYEVLETHTNIILAGDRELELQAEYGYPIDKVHYSKTFQATSKAGQQNQQTKVWNNYTDEERKERSNSQALMHSRGGKTSSSYERTCPHCGLTSKGNGIKRWHFDNCKHKKTLTN